MMNLNDKWLIKKDGTGFALCELVLYKGKKGEQKEKYNKHYYGTLYQGLQGFLIKASSEELSLYNIGLEIESILYSLEKAENKIKDMFCIEVKSVKP